MKKLGMFSHRLMYFTSGMVTMASTVLAFDHHRYLSASVGLFLASMIVFIALAIDHLDNHL